MIVIADTTPLISLMKIGKLNLLKELFDKVFIPERVFPANLFSGRSGGFQDVPCRKASSAFPD